MEKIVKKPVSASGSEIVVSPEQAINLISTVRKDLHQYKVGLNDFRFPLGKKTATPIEIVEILTGMLEVASTEQAKEIWDNFNVSLKALMLIPDKDLNLDLFVKLGLEYGEIAKAYQINRSYEYPKHSAYSVSYGEFDSEESYIDLVYLLGQLQTAQIKQVLESMSPKVLYLLTITEINDVLESDQGLGESLFSAMDIDDLIPLDFSLLNLIQEMAPTVYKNLARELNNKDWDEFRELFYDLQLRNNTLIESFINEQRISTKQYLNQLLDND